MSQPASGLLPALVGYYQRLENDPNEGVAEYGFSVQKISFQIVLEPDGSLFSFDDVRPRNDKGKPIPQTLRVPYGGGRAGKGLNPYLGWDNTGYVLGRDNKGKPERAEEMFAAFRDLHKSFLPELASDEGFVALCRFLDGWKPERAESLPNWEEAASLNVVFKLRAREGYIHQSEPVRAAWLRSITQQDPEEKPVLGISLMSGGEEELARLHPQIKGVAEANTTGAAIVSFNLDAFESYGKSQSFNAPVGTRDAFRYTTALNRLLADDARRVRIGDATVVFWSDRPEGGDAEVVFREMFGNDFPRNEEAEHNPTIARVKNFLEAARQGQLQDTVSDPDAPFYVLGLSPNASRLNVRFWLVGTVRQFAERLARHANDLRIGWTSESDAWISVQSMLAETAREQKDISPNLSGSVTRAILEGLPAYPEILLTGVLRRIQADGRISSRRAAILKAFLKREGRYDVDVYLNKEHPAKAYNCGRLFAVLSFAQKEALGEVNAGVIRRNMGSVMAMPGLMLGRLQRAAEIGHIPKLERDLPEFVRDEIKGINVRLRDDLPSHLTMREQGLFALGFYQELQYLDYVGSQVRGNKRVRTNQGEWVRSKLEKRVAAAFDKLGVEYVYEPSAILDGRERWPDFVIRRGPSRDLYVEVLGLNDEQYNAAWEIKLSAYKNLGITEGGGPKGTLVILDFRTRPYEDTVVMDALRPYLYTNEDQGNEEAKEQDHE